jgi:hypothetical protein
MTLLDRLPAIGASGLRLAITTAGRLGVSSLAPVAPDTRDWLASNRDEVKSAVARMDADLAEALATLDALAARPDTSPALREVVRIRAEVYAEYRARLDPTDLAEDARHFAAMIADPPARDHDWLHPMDCRPARTTQETRR